MNKQNGSIADFLEMQHTLAVEKGWIAERNPDYAPMSILWSIDELGEAIAIIKKKGAEGIMHNESVRGHFVEELADTFMYLFDMMEAYSITAEEFTRAYVAKFEKNLGRNWNENQTLYEKSAMKLIIFDMEATLVHEDKALPWTERLLEVLARTDAKLAVVSDLQPEALKQKLTVAGLDPAAFLCISNTHYADAFADAMAQAGAEKNETVFCTGSAVGVKLAKRNELNVVAVRTHFAADFYQKAGADHVVDDMMQLLPILGVQH